MPENRPPRVRFVILHTPGPRWKRGLDFREQESVEAHVRHYAAVHDAGHLDLGGPFLLPDAGGMMIPVESLPEEEVRRIADSDPAVQAGLLRAEVRPWYVVMRRLP